MPFARLTLAPTPSQDQVVRLHTDLTALIASLLRKRHDLTSVLVETPGLSAWSIDALARGAAAHLEVFVTAGTNTEAEKREFIRSAMAAVRNVLPGLAEATYVVVHELAGTDWGYDGQTQTDRAAKPPKG
jgi:4-oxalocrotonate tautomerase